MFRQGTGHLKPDIKFTWNDGFAIAHQVIGEGRQDLIYLPGLASNVDLHWDIPIYARFLERLASFSRLIVIDRRGVGCSDRFPPGQAPTLEEITDDVLAVMEATSSEHATVFAVQDTAFAALLLAASHPQHVTRLVLFGASPSWLQSADLPDEWSPGQWESNIRSYGRVSSGTDAAAGYIRNAAPSLVGDEAGTRALMSLLFNTNGPGAGAGEARQFSRIDLRHVLPSITAPTLVLRRAGDEVIPASSSRFLAEHIEGAEYLEVPGRDALPWIGDQEPILDAIEHFLGVERSSPVPNRRLATVLFTDLVESAARATSLGDAEWSRVLTLHHQAIRRELAEHGGTEVDTAGDGFFATFSGPAQAVRCALAIADAVAGLGVEARIGVHTGEVETIAGKPGGAAVHLGARIAAAAGPSQVFASQTVKDLVAGSGLTFEDTGEQELKGLPGAWRLYRVVGG
jgi:class 3 adenylate cyclase/pimeloyl-ACP methyl ester carboxylesterase